MNRIFKSLTIVAGILITTASLHAQGIRMLNHTRNGNVIKGVEITEIDSIKFNRFMVPSAADGVEIAGIKWATRNVGAPGTFAATPADAGMFYQWNRTTGWSVTDPLVNHEGGTTWDSTSIKNDLWTVDNNVCPTGWRVPTDEELQSLLDAGNFWGTMNGVNGQFFGSDEQRLFMPAASYRHWEYGQIPEIVPGKPGTFGAYWASTRSVINLGGVIDFGSDALYFHAESSGMDSNPLSYAWSVRCVAEDDIVSFDVPQNGTLTVTAGGAPVENGGTVGYGTALAITATPDNGYELQTLKVNGENFANGSTYLVDSDTYVECTFKEGDGGGIANNTLTNVSVYGNEGSVYIVNKNSVNLKSVQILDMFGRIIYAGKTSSSVTIPVNGASGIYIVKLISDDNKTSSTKVHLDN